MLVMDTDLASGIVQLLTDLSQPFPHERWVELYTRVFKVCSDANNPRPGDLYEDLGALLVCHCQDQLHILRKMPAQELLQAYLAGYKSYCNGTQYVSELMKYLERWWIAKNRSLTPRPGSAFAVYPIKLLACAVWVEEL